MVHVGTHGEQQVKRQRGLKTGGQWDSAGNKLPRTEQEMQQLKTNPISMFGPGFSTRELTRRPEWFDELPSRNATLKRPPPPLMDRFGNVSSRVDGFEALWPLGETVESYTDIGDGSVADDIADVVNAENIHIIDTTEEASVADDSQGLVTAIVSAHHVLDIGAWLDDVARITKDGGYLYIREYDVSGDVLSIYNDAHYLNWVHLIGIVARRARDEIKSFHAEYYAKSDLEVALWARGFMLLKQHVLAPPNPRKIYYELFQRADALPTTQYALTGVSPSLQESVLAYNDDPVLRKNVRRVISNRLNVAIDDDARFGSPLQAYDVLAARTKR